jgi:acetylglutamate kinase
LNDITVIKLGGSLLDDAQRRSEALASIVSLWNAGENLVLVHGGGKHIDARLAQLGIAKKTHAGLRITDDATLDVVVAVLGGTVNKMLVSELTKLGVRAAGISGSDGATLVASRHPALDGIDLGHVGQVHGANTTLVKAMLTYGMLPVVSSIAASKAGDLLNVNADSAASALAVALRARALRFITDVPGVLDENGSVLPELNTAAVVAMLASPAVTGGMKPKLQSAMNALEQGVARITIGTPTTDNGQRTTQGGTTLVAA